MYVPTHFAADDDTVSDLLARHGAADLVTATPDGLLATFLPFIYDPSAGERGALLGHVARNNGQWKSPVLGEALVIVRGPDAYVSPSWYASKAEHGRVVPTWNYVTAHVYGRLVVHDDPAWVDGIVRRLTGKHEAASRRPWSVDDAPGPYVAGQLRAIVGVEVAITRIEAKAKLSQNRPDADIDGVVAGLRARGDDTSAEAVARARPSRERHGLFQRRARGSRAAGTGYFSGGRGLSGRRVRVISAAGAAYPGGRYGLFQRRARLIRAAGAGRRWPGCG